ncbi:RNA polymerase sigma factor [Nocardioides terrisoli]|uniref:RNA polymerase sigma factor n=1 Tax=Nocardioides terrisoli TaxID=3388267 RepID=UPI00287B9F63|nr:sigma-70 family RNA polymerase sigma factor [Nocardioides marmorisolisilvae]
MDEAEQVATVASVRSAVVGPPAPADWLGCLSGSGPVRDDAIRHLHALLVRAARHQVSRMSEARRLGTVTCEGIVQAAADEATVSVLARLSTFEGRSRFTTWAYKFGILHAAVEVRRTAWRGRDVALSSVPEPVARDMSPEEYVGARSLSAALARAMSEVLTPHQRRVAVALLVEGVPIDVLADRLGTNRNALYKTLHDARKRLRVELAAQGYLSEVARREEGS